MVIASWCNVAVPAILYGCEMIPFSEEEIERVQSQIAKYALGLPRSAANVCAQLDLSIKPFRQVLYEAQLKYYVWYYVLMIKDGLSKQCLITCQGPG